MSRPLPSIDVHPDCTGIRTVLVPPDIVGVPRRSPARVRKRTPWRPQPDGQETTARVGQREWFSDRVFVESQDGHTRSGYGLSVVAHACAGVALLVFMIMRPDQMVFLRAGPTLAMPATFAPLPPIPAVNAPATPAEGPQSKTPAVVPAAAPPPVAAPDASEAPAPVEAPSGITPETGAEARAGGVEGGVPGGIAGGVVGGVGNAPASGSGPPGSFARAGTDVKPPRKIKDVKPIYPATALPTRTQGNVLIEAFIGPDGKVHDAKVLHSIPSLDQAALDAVRQWEYEPSLLNGRPIGVILTVVVRFALQ